MKTSAESEQAREYDAGINDPQTILLAQIQQINDDLSFLQSGKKDLLSLKELQFKINEDATNAINGKKTKETRRLFKESNDNLTETETKINKIDIQIAELENELSSANRELKDIPVLLKSQQDKAKEQVIMPEWIRQIDEIKSDIALFEEQQLVNEQDKQRATEQETQLTVQLHRLETQDADIKKELNTAKNEYEQTGSDIDLYKKSTLQSVRYWISIATGGLFKSPRYSSEQERVRLSKKINELGDLRTAQDASIKELKKDISTQQGIIKDNTALLETSKEAMANALQMVAKLESSGLNAINDIRAQCDGWSSFSNKTPIVYSVKQFINEPTPSNLNQLLEKMGEDTAYLKNSKVKNLIAQLGNLYPAIKVRHTLCENDALLKQQQIEYGLILVETDQEKACHEVISNAETDLLLLQDQYQQLSSGLLDKENRSLAIEKAEMKDSIFLRDALKRNDRRSEIIDELAKIEQQYAKLMNDLNTLDSDGGLEQTDLIDISASIDDPLADHKESLQQERDQIDNESRKYTKKQKKQINECTTPLNILEEDIAINRRQIDQIENEIQQIQNGEQTELKTVQDKINVTQEIIEATKQSEQTVIKGNNQALKNIDVSAFIERPELKTLVRACIDFRVAPTNDNLSRLITAIKIDIHRESNPLLLDEIKKIGSMYGAVSDAVAFAQEQKPSAEQMKSEILFTCEWYRQQKSSTNDTSLLKKVSAFLNKDTPEKATKESDITISDIAVINALKSFLTNDAKAKDSLVIIAKYIQSLDIDKPTKTSHLVEKASEINQQIQSLYTVVQATQQTTAFKERFEEQKRSASPQSVAEIDIIEDDQAKLPKFQ